MKKCEVCGKPIMVDKLCRECFDSEAALADFEDELLGDDAGILGGMDFGNK